MLYLDTLMVVEMSFGKLNADKVALAMKCNNGPKVKDAA